MNERFIGYDQTGKPFTYKKREELRYQEAPEKAPSELFGYGPPASSEELSGLL
jgi:hypothetical protein